MRRHVGTQRGYRRINARHASAVSERAALGSVDLFPASRVQEPAMPDISLGAVSGGSGDLKTYPPGLSSPRVAGSSASGGL
jgi:hypothetical protein